ncbi:TldD/PmbA family protein [candidate division WOR-3 bacterium]|nr:TldD/PmbA family protein [candidate division WOR-3 bacterium]
MKELALRAIEKAKKDGAQYADIRIITDEKEVIETRNGKPANVEMEEKEGFGIRVLCDGSWGFASSAGIDRDSMDKTVSLAVDIAKSSALVRSRKVSLAEEKTYQEFWMTPYIIDPFKVPVSEKIDLLLAIDSVLRKKPQIKAAICMMEFWREHQWLATSEGSFIEQVYLRSGAGCHVTAVGNHDMQVRTYPNTHRGQFLSMGYELIPSLDLVENAERVSDEAVALLSAENCPTGRKDIVLTGSQMVLQIHESVGHATELDRVLGYEANYAGRSFATMEKLNKFRYGSDIVNLVADNTLPGGLSTARFDDDAVPAKRWHIVKDGIFSGYMTNREIAFETGQPESMGCNRAQGFSNIPIVRIANLSLMPGSGTLEDIIADTEDGILMDTNKSWSIDQMRLNFQFGVEAAWEIKKGKRTKLLKNANYQSTTPEFWNSCDRIAGHQEWKLWGVKNCGKGQPGQSAEMSHGSSPARFRNIEVGVGNDFLEKNTDLI